MDYRILKLLGLQGLTLITMVEHFPNVFLYVLPRRKTADCPVCNHRSKYIHEYRPPQVVKHHRLGRK